jgi:hypothetical protein
MRRLKFACYVGLMTFCYVIMGRDGTFPRSSSLSDRYGLDSLP